jgi:hypothetical protein
VLVYIQQHLVEAISLDDQARVAHVSPYHFHRLFRGMTGESMMEHIRRLRLYRVQNRSRASRYPNAWRGEFLGVPNRPETRRIPAEKGLVGTEP